MGEGREDTDLDPKRAGTEPGQDGQDVPPPVDFDALHAALGDPLEYEELSSGPAVDKAAADNAVTGVSESSGATNATYASARPRTIPPTRAPAEDPNAPAVIVATDTDTVPTAPPQMTVPLGAPPQFGGVPHGAPGSNPHVVAGGRTPPSGPHGIGPGHPGSGPHAASPRASHPFTPQAFPVQPVRGAPQMTMRMPDRPLNERNMRRGKTPTIVVRPRGPSAKQKLVAFMAMLLLVTACGIAVIIWRKPRLLGLDPVLGAPPATAPLPAASAAGSTGALSPSPAASVSPTTAATASSLSVAGTSSAAAGATSPSASAAASASAKKLPKPPAPVPHPTASVAPLLK